MSQGSPGAAGRLSRRAVLATGSVLIAPTTGCTSFLGEEGASSDAPLVDRVPSDATGLVRIDVAALGEADLDRLRAELEDVESVRLDVDAALAALEARTGLDFAAAERVLLFERSAADADESGQNAGPTDAVVDADWPTADVVASLEEATGVEYEAAEYAGESAVYEPTESASADSDSAADGPPYLGVLADGRYAIGNEGAVLGSLETRYGDGESPSGPVREAYDGAREAPLVIAVEPAGSLLPEALRAFAPPGTTEALESVTSLGGSADVLESGVDLVVTLHTTGEEAAADLEEVVRGMVALLAETDEDHGEDLARATVDREGARVDLSYEGQPDPVLALLAEV